MGLGAWGLGFGVLAPTPNPQSPIPNPHFQINCGLYKLLKFYFINSIYFNFLFIKKDESKIWKKIWKIEDTKK